MTKNNVNKIWDSMKSKLDSQQAQHLMNLTQVEYNFNFDNIQLISKEPSQIRDNLMREMLVKINSIKELPFIAHIFWEWTFFPINMNKENRLSEHDVFDDEEAFIIFFFGLFDVYMVVLGMDQYHEFLKFYSLYNDPLSVEKIVLAFIEKLKVLALIKKIGIEDISTFNKEIIDFYEKYNDLSGMSKLSGASFEETMKITNYIKDLKSEGIINEWWKTARTFGTGEETTKTFMRAYTSYFYNNISFDYRMEFQYMFFNKYSQKNIENHLKIRELNKKEIEIREKRLNKIQFPILMNPQKKIKKEMGIGHWTQFNIEFAGLKKELLRLLNTLTENQKYLYIEYTHLFQNAAANKISDLAIILDIVVGYDFRDEHLRLDLFDTKGKKHKFEQDPSNILTDKPYYNNVYIKELKSHPGNYYITNEKDIGAIQYRNHINTDKVWQAGIYLTDTLTNNYFFAFQYWMQLLTENGLNIFTNNKKFVNQITEPYIVSPGTFRLSTFQEFYPTFNLNDVEKTYLSLIDEIKFKKRSV